MEEIKYNRTNPRYRSGQFYKHNKHGFIIQLVRKHWGKWVFRIVRGELPFTLRPDNYIGHFTGASDRHEDDDDNREQLYEYSCDSLRQSFTLISGKGAEVLFGIKDRR